MLRRHKQNLVCTRAQEKGAGTPKDTEPDLGPEPLSMALPMRARPSLTHSQSLPLGSLGSFTSLLSSSRQNENHNHRKLIRLITWITVLSNSVSWLWAILSRATQDRHVMMERSDKMWSNGNGVANHFSILALRTPWTVWKDKKRYDTGRWTPRVSRCLIRH